MNGKADVINAQGEFLKQSEDARLQREQVNQSKLETKKKTLDEMWYERENMPTFSDDRERAQRLQLRASLKSPPINEITSARALNQLLPYTQQLAMRGSEGRPIPLDQTLLSQVNFVSANQASPALLKDGGRMSFPIALRGPVQQELQQEIIQAVNLARSDNLTVDLLMQINANVAKLEKSLSDGIRASKIDTTMWINGNRFLDELKTTLRVLQQPNVAEILGGAYNIQAATVQELVQVMARQGLTFAPALPGAEGAYLALHNALSSFALDASPDDSAFRIRLTELPIQQAPPQKQ